MRVCAVIPAAGKGSRLGLSCPKILAPLGNGRTIWSVLRDKLNAHCDHIHVVLSPSGIDEYSQNFHCYSNVTVSVQPEPIGMGDAVFRGYSVWKEYDVIIVIWGDQVFVSDDTLVGTLKSHKGKIHTLVLPLVSVEKPYVEYILGENNRLLDVRQSREGDICTPYGYNDIGTFVLSVNDLYKYWEKYLSLQSVGASTGEINFIPFLPFLSKNGWSICVYSVKDARESRGINTPDDLHYFSNII